MYVHVQIWEKSDLLQQNKLNFCLKKNQPLFQTSSHTNYFIFKQNNAQKKKKKNLRRFHKAQSLEHAHYSAEGLNANTPLEDPADILSNRPTVHHSLSPTSGKLCMTVGFLLDVLTASSHRNIQMNFLPTY